MNLSLDRLLFDPSDADNSPNLGAYLRAGSDGDLITSTLSGGKEALDVNVVGTSDGGVFAEDAAHVSGDKGVHILAVRNDTQGSLVSADGDYGSLQLDSAGRLRVVADIDLTGDLVADGEADSEDPLKIGSHAYDQASALGAVDAGDKANLASDLYRRIFINDAPNISVASATVTVGTTEVALPTTALAGRTRMIIQNKGSSSVYVGPTGLSTSDGIEITKGGTLALEIGQAVALYGISGSAGQDVRVFELA